MLRALKNSTKWLPGKTEIPGGFSSGCAFAVEWKQEIWLIGGCKTANRILIFNVNDHIFHASPSQLIGGGLHTDLLSLQKLAKSW